ncbi:AlbA family DNA-binding domain-containing protein [Kordiimonas aestuarii]|uniref:AlbA family DNA-binding domain-containing protein n=1 Tax=Kordiimonas aestuarii TaxID=1005925 RepID=UPI0021CE4498|nr:ATP-binding protein [Kordiimonas aestuarii]
MPSYTPFDKELSAIEASDLAVLRSVSEGWYVEYKRVFTNTKSIAKSVSAMANTSGGWIFVGIDEKSKDENVAGGFPGIQTEDLQTLTQRIRQGVHEHLNPSCHYEIKIVRGPNDDIGLDANKAIVCLYVPESYDTPHIHSSGCIFRRAGDSSEPIAETDRHSLERLLGKRETVAKNLKKWIQSTPKLESFEEDQPYARLLFLADSIGNKSEIKTPIFAEFRDVMCNPGGGYTSLLFDACYSSASGLIARMTKNNDPERLTLTCILRRNYNCEFIIPFSYGGYALLEAHTPYQSAPKFVEQLKTARFQNPRITDLNRLWILLAGIVNIYERLLRISGVSVNYSFKVQLNNIWRTIPYLDSATYISHIKEIGVPLALEQSQLFPPSYDRDSFQELIELEADTEIDIRNADAKAGQEIKNSVRSAQIFIGILHAYGIPAHVTAEGPEFMQELIALDRRFVTQSAGEETIRPQ